MSGQIPSATFSYYVPQAGPVAAPTEGMEALRFFRACPNNESQSTSLPNSARIRLVIRDELARPIPGIAPADICVRFNGGTAAQGFGGDGADSVIANSQWNPSPLCPDVRCLSADAPTDAFGITYITFMGADPSNPGVGARDASRKWGHYDSQLPVFAMGVQLVGRLTSGEANGTYILRIKNMDWTGGLDAMSNQGERVTVSDFNGIATTLGVHNAMSYWKDLDSSGSVQLGDLNLMTAHLNHNCAVPMDP